METPRHERLRDAIGEPEQESGAYSVHVWPEKAADGGLGLVVADVPVAFWPPSDDDLDQLA